jgi:hypothetical protein
VKGKTSMPDREYSAMETMQATGGDRAMDGAA